VNVYANLQLFFEPPKFYGIFSVTTTRISIFSEIRYKGAVFWGMVLEDSQQAYSFKHPAVGCGFVVKGERLRP